MNETEQKVLNTGAIMYTALPLYLNGSKNKQEMGHILIDLIDALDEVEYARSGTPLFDIIGGSMPGKRKKAIMLIEKEFGLTSREGHILRYLANDRNPSYIASILNISKSTAKAHKYSIFKKLGIHSGAELKELFKKYGMSEDPIKTH